MSDITFGFCHCGCGQRTPISNDHHPSRGTFRGQPYRFIVGHNRRKAIVTERYRDGVPSFGRYVLKHIAVAEAALGRRLQGGVQVHHVDGNGLNNMGRNLVICQDAAYHMFLHRRARVVAAGGDPNTHALCSRCRQCLPLTMFNRRGIDQGRMRDGCVAYCRPCHAIMVAQKRHNASELFAQHSEVLSH